METRLALTEEDTINAADALGYPVALKLHSFTITHKTDIGGVKLRLGNADSVRLAWREIKSAVEEKANGTHFAGVTVQRMVAVQGYELILGCSVDPQFGPVVLFGAGGELVEIFEDRALALPPLNTTLARRFMEQTKIYKALCGVRGRKPVDIAGLEQLLVRFSRLVLEQPFIKEIDINPLLASGDMLLALDARIVLHDAVVKPTDIPQPAIRPYPAQYAQTVTLRDATELQIRPIRPEDELEIVRFHSMLSEQTVYRRFFNLLTLENRIRHERLIRTCCIDYDRQMAFVAERTTPDHRSEIVGVARLIKGSGPAEGEIAAVVSDEFQQRGIGGLLVDNLIRFAKVEEMESLVAVTLVENRAMQMLLEKRGFAFSQTGDPDILEGRLHLKTAIAGLA